MPVDCIAGQQAHEALRKFQTESGLHPTGELDAPAKERLGIR
ncbi:MAG: peptidoglycan-binding protein [Bryobacteraceae bacterium]